MTSQPVFFPVFLCSSPPSIKLEAAKLSQDDSHVFGRKLTDAEAPAALRQMKNDKNPGSDSFTTEIYKKSFGTTFGHSW